jgi:hypothetical protein
MAVLHRPHRKRGGTILPLHCAHCIAISLLEQPYLAESEIAADLVGMLALLRDNVFGRLLVHCPVHSGTDQRSPPSCAPAGVPSCCASWYPRYKELPFFLCARIMITVGFSSALR